MAGSVHGLRRQADHEAGYRFYPVDSAFQLIIRRFVRQLGRKLLFWVIVPIAVLIVFNLFTLLAAYVECRAFGSVTWGYRTPFNIRGFVCDKP